MTTDLFTEKDVIIHFKLTYMFFFPLSASQKHVSLKFSCFMFQNGEVFALFCFVFFWWGGGLSH